MTEDKALAAFTEYFVRNYPGQTSGTGSDTIISNPHWHAPKIFRAAKSALERAGQRAPRHPDAILAWAIERWESEVKNRPLVNVHRRTLDDTWRQVIRHFGGDPVTLLGPAHDDLLAATKSSEADGKGIAP